MNPFAHGFKWALAMVVMLALALPATAQQQDEPLTLVEHGEARVRIVIGEDATPTVAFAAKEFQKAIELISGAKLPIATANAIADEGGRIVLGTPEHNALVETRAQQFAGDLAYLEGTDGFAVRREGDTLYIFAAMPKGVLNGIYDVLEDNTSLLWFRPGPEGIAYEKTNEVAIEKVDYREKPVFAMRGWLLLGIRWHLHEPTALWMIRNRCNYKSVGLSILGNLLNDELPRNDTIFKRERPLLEKRFQSLTDGTHNISFWISPEKYFKKHPEWFAMLGGMRRFYARRGQLCYSNQQMTDFFIDRVLNRIAKLPPGIDEIGIFQEDDQDLCQCKLCTSPIRLPDGTVVKPSDEAFRSTQFFLFFNQIARAVQEHYPDMKVLTFAYLFTAVPPKVEIPDNVFIRLCPYPASSKHTLHQSPNEEWLRRTRAWTSKAEVCWREYYGGGMGTPSYFPRPIAQTVQGDMQYLHKLGVQRVFSGMQPDAPNRGYQSDQLELGYTWDASGMQFWLISRLWWNPDADLDELRQRYLNRVYKQAAPAMADFFAMIHDSWYGSPVPEYHSASHITLAKRYIVEPGIEDHCRAALERAAALAKNDRVAARVEAIRTRFDVWMDKIAAHANTNPAANVPATNAGPANVLNFNAPAWDGAMVIDGFVVMGKPDTPSRARTVVRLLHDQQNLYIGVRCFDQDGEIHAPTHDGYEKFPDGDRIELFFAGGEQTQALYYHFAFNAAGWRYEADVFNKAWDGDWSVKTRIGDGGWRAVAVIPLKTIGVNPEEDMQISALFYRYTSASSSDLDAEHSAWGGGRVHAPPTFGTLTLKGM